MPSTELTSELLAPFADRPERAGVFSDFDGTLAPIVEDPAAARPLDGAVAVLDELARRCARVGVISGRPVDVLAGLLPESLFLSGVYGLEIRDTGGRRDHPEAARWREVVADVAGRASRELPADLIVEPKGLSLTLHFRTAPDMAQEVQRWAAAEAGRSGLEVRPARQSVELHPAVEADKGTALAAAAAGLDPVCFLGDDLGDLPAFAALERMGRQGVHVLRVGVLSDEAPPGLADQVDVVVDGPEGALSVLRTLAGT